MSATSTSTYDRLLAAATDEFAALGLAGARVDRISQRAGANKQLLYHHFGSKEGLFRAVLEQKLRDFAGALPAESASMRDLASGIFGFYAANPTYVRLVVWEALHYGTQRVPGERARTRSYQALVGILDDAQSRGSIAPEIDTTNAAIDLIAVIAWPFVAAPMARMIGGSTSRIRVVWTRGARQSSEQLNGCYARERAGRQGGNQATSLDCDGPPPQAEPPVP